MALRSALKLNFKNETDQKIIETFSMSIIVLNLVDMQRASFQLKNGKYIGSDSGPDAFLVTLPPEEKLELQKALEKSQFRTQKLLADVKGDGNPNYYTPLQNYLKNYKAPKDRNSQMDFISLKRLPRQEQRILQQYAQTGKATNLTKAQKRTVEKFASMHPEVQKTLLNLYSLSPYTQRALELSENLSRKKILKLTQNNLSLTRKEPGEYTLTDSDIYSIERRAINHDIDISALRAKTDAKYTSEKNAVQKMVARRTAIALTLLTLLATIAHTGHNLAQDISTVAKTNNQSFQTLYDQGFSHVDFDIDSTTLEELLTIQNSLSQYAIKEPSYDEQLELIDSMSDTYQTIIGEKASSAFLEQNPDSEISNLTFNNEEITISYSEDGKISTKTFKVKDLAFQDANLSDIMKSFSTLQQIKTETETDKKIQEDIDTAIANGISVDSTEYKLTDSIETRIQKLTDLNQTVSNATALNLTLRDNLIFDDQFISTAQSGSPAYVAPEPVTEEITMTENAGPTNAKEFFNVNEFKTKDVLTHLKQFFTREHNVANPTEAVSSHDIKITQAPQTYAYFVTVGDTSYIMTHGSYPSGVESFLNSEAAKGTLTYYPTGEINITQVIKDATVYDDNGNRQTSVMVDGAAHYNGQVYPVISGNFHNSCLDSKHTSILANPNIYAATQAMFETKTAYPTNEYYIDNAKQEYAEALNSYCAEQGYSVEDINPTTSKDDDGR